MIPNRIASHRKLDMAVSPGGRLAMSHGIQLLNDQYRLLAAFLTDKSSRTAAFPGSTRPQSLVKVRTDPFDMGYLSNLTLDEHLIIALQPLP